MKFGEHLKQNVLNPWKIEYIQYDILKNDLKQRQLNREWDDMDEANFIQLFSNEKSKIKYFIINYNQQLISRIMYARHLLESSIANFQTNQRQKQAIEYLNTIDDSLVEIIFDINDFANFVHLNKLGFAKILKKHRKWTLINHEGVKCFEYQSIDAELGLNWEKTLYTQVSLLRNQCRQKVFTSKLIRRNSVMDLENVIPTTATERKVKKYWVLPQHVSEVIAMLSIHSFVVEPPSKKSASNTAERRKFFDFAMSNVYFENNTFDSYSGRLGGKENTQSIKCKRYYLRSSLKNMTID